MFDNFYYIWAKLKNGDEECKDVEWKRRMHFVLDQLKTSKTLTHRYALYHGLALALDLVSLLLVGLYTLNFMNIDPLGLGSDGSCAFGTFSCTMPHKTLFKWFGVLSILVLVAKAAVNLKCFLFCLGMPGLFGRNFLIYADQLQVQSTTRQILNLAMVPHRTSNQFIFSARIIPVRRSTRFKRTQSSSS